MSPAELFVDSVLGAITASGTPDLWVSSVSGPASATPGNSFFLTVTACNQGAGSAAATVHLHLSSDTSFTAADPQVGTVSTGMLHPQQCATLNVPTTGTGGVTSGLWYAGAIIDPGNAVSESSETNNTRAGTRMAFGTRPDLTVTQVSVPASLEPSGNLKKVEATVCNTGTESSSSSQVEFLLSADTAISAADTVLSSATVNPLEAGQCTTLKAPSSGNPLPMGSWYVGAWVDRPNAVAELVESNNTRASSKTAVGSGPDFAITTISSPVLLTSSVTLQATVCNQGTLGGETTLEGYLSADTTLTTADVLVGGVPVPYLEAGQCAPVRLTGPVNVNGGNWYVGLWVDRPNAVAELTENNNTRIGSRLAQGSGPDLVVTAVSGPASVEYQQPVNATATVCNQGTDFSPEQQLAFYLSLDASLASSDPQLGTATVPGLGAGECTTVAVSGSANVNDGTWYVGAWVDRTNAVAEVVESNNTRVGGQLGVGVGADLVIQALTGPASARPGDLLRSRITLCNQGTRYIQNPARVALYLSSDTFITAADLFLGEETLSGLDPEQCRPVTLEAGVSVPPGVWYLGAIADVNNSEAELIENNNTRLGEALVVGDGPDYVVSAVHLPSALAPGQSFSAAVTVCNQGTMATYDVPVSLHFSADATLTPEDRMVGGAVAQRVEPGRCASVTVDSSSHLAEGTWYVGGIVDSSDTQVEVNESNNAGPATRVELGSMPDLVLSELTAPSNVRQSRAFTAEAVVCNRGTAFSGPSSLELHASRDRVITPLDLGLAEAELPPLEPGECAAATLHTESWLPLGTWTLGVRLDRFNAVSELREDNNDVAGPTLAVGNGPDLVVSQLRGPTAARRFQHLQFTATVCNQGNQPVNDSLVRFVFSADARVTEQDFHAGVEWVDDLGPGQCQDLQVQSYAEPEEGAWYLGAIVDPHQGTPELREDNNVAVVPFIIGQGGDLSITQVSAPQGVVYPYQDTLVPVTVCNEGTEMTYGGRLELYGSKDEVLSQEDLPLGWEPVYPMEPGQCRIVNVQVFNGPTGQWKLGAVLDLDSYTPDLRPGNNSRFGGSLVIGHGSDLIITALTTEPHVEHPGRLDAIATVCNQGSEWTDGVLELVLSEDRIINPSEDPFAGRPLMGHVQPGECRDVRVPLPWWMPSGVWTLGARIDGMHYELRKDNNLFVGDRIVVGSGTDLAITAVRAPRTVSDSYGQFHADFTVCNLGNQYSGGTSLALYFSSDATLDDDDQPVGHRWVPSLPGGECLDLSVDSHVYMPQPGKAHFGARLYGQDLNPDNNARTVELFVGNGWDLAITEVRAPRITSPGMPVKAQVTVCNQGTLTAPPTDVELFQEDPFLTPSEQYIGNNQWVPELQGGECTTVEVEGYPYTPDPDREWRVGARFPPDAWNFDQDLRKDNNRLSQPIFIGYGADLSVTAVQLPANALPGQSLMIDVTVCNTGSAQSMSGELDLTFSRDDGYDYESWPFSDVGIPPLDSGQCTTLSVPGFVSNQWGLWTFSTRVYGLYEELFRQDNFRTHGTLPIGHLADLVVTQVSGPTVVESYTSFPVEATVCNVGSEPSEPGQVGFYLTYDSQVTLGDLQLGTAPVPALASGACAPVSSTVSGPYSSEVPFRLGALVDFDQYVQELNERNNSVVGSWLAIGSGPELIVSSVTGPAAVTPYQSFDAQVTVCNVGTSSAHGVEVALLLSRDGTVTREDKRVGYTGGFTVDPGQCVPFTVPAYAEVSEGTWTLGAFVDPHNAYYEPIEQNNITAGSPLGVGYKAELNAASVLGPASVASGGSFFTDVEVCNSGTDSAADAEVTVVFSTDDTFTLDDVVAGSALSGSINPGQCVVVSVPGTAYPGQGSYQLGAIVDSGHSVPEFNEVNNTASGGGVDVL